MLAVQFTGTYEHTPYIIQLLSLVWTANDNDGHVQEDPIDATHYDRKNTGQIDTDGSNVGLHKNNQSRETPSGETLGREKARQKKHKCTRDVEWKVGD